MLRDAGFHGWGGWDLGSNVERVGLHVYAIKG